MRTIENLLRENERVWFFLRNDEAETAFAKELTELGACYLNGSKITAQSCSPIMSVHKDLRVAHLMIMIWNASFKESFNQHCAPELANVLRVDYEKYVNGESDYVCTKSEFYPA